MSIKFVVIYDPSVNERFQVVGISSEDSATNVEDTIRRVFSLKDDFNIGFKYFRNDNDELAYITLKQLIPFVLEHDGENELCVRLTDMNDIQYDDLDEEDIHHSSWENDVYFGEYAKLYVHHLMIGDDVRCSAYRNAVMKNKSFIEGKTVLDVGCGTGLLSIFCAQAGAKKVYAVEASGISDRAIQLIKHNGYDNIVEVIKGKVEDITLPVEQVDIIISEWMGLFLLFEAMLESVIFARDKWLKDDGIMLPTHARLFLSPVANDEFREKADFFKEPKYDIDMSIFVDDYINEQTFYCARAQEIKEEWVCCNEIEVISFETKTVTKEFIRDFQVEFYFDVFKRDYFNVIGTWFDVTFALSKEIVLRTSPYEKSTHWKQDMFLLEDAYPIGENSRLNGKFVAKQSKYKRHYDIFLEMELDGEKIQKKWLI